MNIDQIRAEVNAAQKSEFISLLRSTERDGVENLIDYLENKSDFFKYFCRILKLMIIY